MRGIAYWARSLWYIATPAEASLHARHPSHIWDVIWMPLALATQNFGDDWLQPNAFRKTGESLVAFYLAHRTKDPYLPSLCRVKAVVVPAHNVAEQGGAAEN